MRYQTDIKALVLSVLAQGPNHGYGIAKTVRERSDGVLKLGEGQLYPALHALEEAGLVTSGWEGDGDQKRRTYSITSSGLLELKARTARWGAFAEGVGKVFDLSAAEPEACR
ncbi:MAG: helix-turn-helix transcriptional regulator [Fimbriimonas sp.]|nr:helix-turn-helix transcriptional regulator [Fimbriimonas sp.]